MKWKANDNKSLADTWKPAAVKKFIRRVYKG